MNLRSRLRHGLAVVCLSLISAIAMAETAPAPGALPDTAMPSVITVPPEAQPSANFNADAATNA